jgi:hypothetical protein
MPSVPVNGIIAEFEHISEAVGCGGSGGVTTVEVCLGSVKSKVVSISMFHAS